LKQRQIQEDPDVDPSDAAYTSVAPAGVDKWALMETELLGAFGYITGLSTLFIWHKTLIHLRKPDVEMPVRNDLPRGLNAIKYYWDNSLEIAKSAVGYVSFCRLLQIFIVHA
jgi:hypothetical protein